jgi:hypothetical protein
MRTTTKRVLACFFYFIPLQIVRMAGTLTGILWAVFFGGFRDGRKVDEALTELFDEKHNDPEYRHNSSER